MYTKFHNSEYSNWDTGIKESHVRHELRWTCLFTPVDNSFYPFMCKAIRVIIFVNINEILKLYEWFALKT
jgi:hypothetical protein